MKKMIFFFLATILFGGCGAGDVFRKTDSGIGPTVGDRVIIGVGSWGSGTPQLLINDYSTRIYPQGAAYSRPVSGVRTHDEGLYGDPHVVVFRNTTQDTVFRLTSNSWTSEPLEVLPGQVTAPQLFPTGDHLIVVRGERQTSLGVDPVRERVIRHRVDPQGRARIINLP